VRDEYQWHTHDDSDLFFMVLDGELAIDLEDQSTIVLHPRDVFVIPKGVRHCPHASDQTTVLVMQSHDSVVGEEPSAPPMSAIVEDLSRMKIVPENSETE